MKRFNVLDRQLNTHQHYLLEASAGTGKTFSIQNIFVRLLIESSAAQEEPLTIKQILVVTFTRAATRDLRLRIRQNIEQALQYINEWLYEKNMHPHLPDYLLALLEKEPEIIGIAKKRLQQALFAFDQAQIFTIHSFCARMLRQYAIEGDISFQPQNSEEALPATEVMSVIRDFFRIGIRSEAYSAAQLAIILKEDPDQKRLLRTVQRGYDFTPHLSFENLFEQFTEQMQTVKQLFDLTSEKMIEDFKAQYELYRNYKAGETKAEMLAKAERFAALFDQSSWTHADFDLLIADGLVWSNALQPSLLKARATLPEKLFYPQLTSYLKSNFEPIVRQASTFAILLARLASDCQQLLLRYKNEEEKLSPDDLLRKMDEALAQDQFIEQIQSTYLAAIIDEFQDTDPLQWKIFKRLFIPDDLRWKGYLYLVGDPKQSIYSFRQADIYTYLAAAQALGSHYCFSLDTNYRSQPLLVQALNALFCHAPDLIPLPKKETGLPYLPVNASKQSTPRSFEDQLGAAHLFIADGKAFKKPTIQELEAQVFFPFIANEINSLHFKSDLQYRQMAILVRDRYQAIRLTEFLESKKIPYINQRGTSLAESVVLTALIDVLRAVLHPRDMGAIKSALGGLLIAWTETEMRAASQMEQALLSIQSLRRGLFEKGFSYFFQELLQSCWLLDEVSVLERLLGRENGIDLYHDLQQIADIIIDHQYQEWNGPEGLVPFLDRFHIWESNEDARVKRFQDPAKNGVQILTLHFSKGLEFDVVFALGLVNRSGGKEDLIPIEKEGRILLTPMWNEREEHRPYFEESDAEKMRQLYVGLTRAKYRLYIPVALGLSGDPQWGEASPMELFLARLAQPSAPYPEIYERIKGCENHILINFLDSVGKENGITYSLHPSQDQEWQSIVKSENKHELISPKKILIPNQPLTLASFTSLTQYLAHGSPHLSPPQDFAHNEKTVHTFPAGSEIGALLHRILEKIKFANFASFERPEQAVPLLQSHLQLPKFKNWEEVISQLVLNALLTPLPIGNKPLRLADVDALRMYREMPFLFPAHEPLKIEGIHFSEGFIKGVVDLIFQHEDKYYIVDWKSNWLGNDPEAYQEHHLQAAMQANHYFLQASLYAEALERYLKLVEPRPFQECFGGAIYLFMRGMQPGSTNGIYSFVPTLNVEKKEWAI
jgi:exodeoxyribonuclease V beta subunit